MPKLKQLFKKFSFREILTECEKQGWKLPSYDEVRGQTDIDHNVVWVSDVPVLEEDRETHAMIYVVDKDKLELCNKNFMHPIVVIKIKRCPTCGN